MNQSRTLIIESAKRGADYLDGLRNRRVAPAEAELARLAEFDLPLQSEPMNPLAVIEALDTIGSPGTVANAGGRYFGFITGGSLPAALGANLLAGCWDQNAVLDIASPVAAILEEISRKWLIDLIGLPEESGIGFVSGATMANFAGLAAARHMLLERLGWDVEAQGLFGAPAIRVIVGDEVHVSALKAIGLLGMGRERVIRVAVDSQGRMLPDALASALADTQANDMEERGVPTIVCLQAGNVNSGAFDSAQQLIPIAKAGGAWVHVDGAFGLWTATCKNREYLFKGYSEADSWATDAHKWLNVPYDSGLVFVRDALQLRAAMSTSAAYLTEIGNREPSHYTPELSRRARGVEIWAALRSLGRKGLEDLIERCCRFAEWMAEGLQQAGYQVLNEIVSNQVLVSFGSPEETLRVIRAVQQEGTCWAGSTVWQGNTAMRISISSWATTQEDIEMSLQAILRTAAKIVKK